MAGTASNYIDALRYFATDLQGIPFFPREPVIHRLLDGYQKLVKSSAFPKLGIDALFLRRLVQHVDTMDVGRDTSL